ncbi:DUF4242 domain-containing protein [Peredibacter starrii]|uniref:DUF4242 domain-containing protein n=1 Tax=Peredibacter starrii TaxID=28202 RepID=A0AAX4HMB1_9BACT|nr:DUF4242 domain-containing protein [Peredibacter starrii]WPU64351.1 DUF4242 domain-containing protein [Peredibacter starrii]
MLKKYIIERNLEGVGNSSEDDFRKMTGSSNEILRNLGPDIQWRESYVTGDKVYCVYLANDENILREHAKQANFPIDKISEVKTVLDPTTTGLQTFLRGTDTKEKQTEVRQ